jgi:hypothetical protein
MVLLVIYLVILSTVQYNLIEIKQYQNSIIKKIQIYKNEKMLIHFLI